VCDLEDYISALTAVRLFQCFSKEELSTLLCQGQYRIRKYGKNEVIYLQGEKCVCLEIILDGTIYIQQIDASGDLLTLCTMLAGDSIGENLLFSCNNAFPMTMTAKCETEILQIDKELILTLCQSSESFLKSFLQSMSDKTLILAGKIKILSMKTIRQYLVELLLCEHHLQQSMQIRLNVSKKELAEKLGVQRPSLSRELNKMREDGLIAFDAKSITILNMEELKNLQASVPI
jgi:CRP-like cAMP-binding protein